jgi:hypothetical protein
MAVLRKITGSPREVFVAYAGRGDIWLRKIEAGIIPLMPEVALQISLETGIDVDWLMAGNPAAPPISRTGQPYTKGFYQWWRGRMNDRDAPAFPTRLTISAVDNYVPRIVGIGQAAGRKGMAAVFHWKVARFLDAMGEEFGTDDDARAAAELALFKADEILAPADQAGEISRALYFSDGPEAIHPRAFLIGKDAAIAPSPAGGGGKAKTTAPRSGGKKPGKAVKKRTKGQ